MSQIGLEDISYSKEDFQNEKGPVFATRKLIFAHKSVSGGETSLNLLSLTTPTEYTANGFVQPGPTEISAARLSLFRKNLKIWSSLHGYLRDYDTYIVSTATTISFIGAKAGGLSVGEIIVGEVDQVPNTAIVTADAKSYRKTFTLAIGATTSNLGIIYKVADGVASDQIGQIKVWRNGILQLRNTNNATAAPAADGNYQEIDSGNGYGTTIAWNNAPVGQDDSVVVEWGLQVSNGDLNTWGDIELLQGVTLAMANDLALVTGNPITNYLTANPAQTERRAFGDLVLLHSQQIAAMFTGVTDGSLAAAGKIGEVLSSVLNSGVTGSATASTYTDITTLVLTPGDWDITAFANIYTAGAVGTGFQAAMANISLTNAANAILADQIVSAANTASPLVTGSGTLFYPISVSVNTTVKLRFGWENNSGSASITGLSAYGGSPYGRSAIYARRRR